MKNLGTVLSVWAHPDDEAYLCGGLMALASDAGSRVVCVTATRGEQGTSDPQRWPPERLATQRTTELERCLEILGVAEHHWLGYRDGQCAAVPPSDAVARLGELVRQVRPDTVVTFGPDGNTGHPDHQAVAGWVATAVDLAARPQMRLLQSVVGEDWARRWKAVNERFDVFTDGYPVTTPEAGLTVRLQLDPATTARKVGALAAQTTQTNGLIAAMGLDEYSAWVSEEAFVQRAASPEPARPEPRWWDHTAARWSPVTDPAR